LWRLTLQPNSHRRIVVDLPWSFPLTVDSHDLIGRSIIALNTLDLPVTESICRLLDEGDTCADIGANIGYMTSVMAARLRDGGIVLAFEPLPELADALRAHVQTWAELTRAGISVHQVALGAHYGPATIYIPKTFATNRGEASMGGRQSIPRGNSTDYSALTVECVRLDDVVDPARPPALVKLDVEGFEYEVLQGAEVLLRTRRIRDVIFEEYRPFEAPSLALLKSHGYEVFRVTRGWSGPGLMPPDFQPRGELDPPTYLATANSARARERFARRGWMSLRKRWP
jgi:FkbM family methyltransferase